MALSPSSLVTLSLLCLLLRSVAYAQDVAAPQAGAAPAVELAPADQLTRGNHLRTLTIGSRKRAYRVHVPPKYEAGHATPVVLALHGAAMNGALMPEFTGLNRKADEAGFIAVYPSGTGVWPFLVWNAGRVFAPLVGDDVDDVAFISAVLDDLQTVASVDERRIFACGLSNGGMMCYRLAAELSERIAAIAPVAGTVAVKESHPQRPVPVLHFHGTRDTLVPFGGGTGSSFGEIKLRSVEESLRIWVKLNECQAEPRTELLSEPGKGLKVTRTTYGGGTQGAEVVLVKIEEGGHTWPGAVPPVGFLGKSALNISANDLMWEFFAKHPLSDSPAAPQPNSPQKVHP